MDYINKELKKGIKFHFIKNDKFKTNLIAIFLTTPLDRKGVTKNALIPAILRRGSAFLNTQDKISKTLEEMYGAVFDCGIDKTGDSVPGKTRSHWDRSAIRKERKDDTWAGIPR